MLYNTKKHIKLKVSNLLLLFIIFLFSILAAIRFLGVDRDFSSYQDFFNELALPYEGRFEIGFVYLSYFIKRTTNSFEILLFISCIFSLSFKFYLIHKLPKYLFWIIIYLLVLYPLHEMTQIRSAIAIGVGYFALYLHINKNNRFLSIILFLLSSMFQYTILILMPFFLLSKFLNRFDWRIFLAFIFFPSLFLKIILEDLVFFNPLVFYALNIEDQIIINPFSVLNLSLISMLILGLFSVNKLSANKIPWLYISAMGLGLWYGFMSIPVFAHRLLELSIFSYFFWMPYMEKNNRIIGMLIFLILAIYLFTRAIFIDPLFV